MLLHSVLWNILPENVAVLRKVQILIMKNVLHVFLMISEKERLVQSHLKDLKDTGKESYDT